jgi:type VI secretion system protein ImpH
LLADRIGAPVRVRQCQPRKALIPADQRCNLGVQANSLGRDSRLGSGADDATGKISITVGPVDAETFMRFLPGLPDHDELLQLVRFYCTQPLEFDLEFALGPREAVPGRLGGPRWSRLGCDVWLSSKPLSRARAVFPERRRIWDDHKQRSIVL